MKLIPLDYAVRNLGRSPVRMAGILLGNILVVLLVLGAAAFVEGMRNSLQPVQDANNVLLLGVGSEESVERSEIPANAAALLSASVPGIRTEFGVPFVSPEVQTALIIHRTQDEKLERRAVVRGVTSAAFLVHPRIEIVEGRAPVPGNDELLVGGLAGEKTGLAPEDLAVGKQLWFDHRPWTIVGRHRAPGTVMEAEIWMPLTDLKIATKRETDSCVVVTLDTAELADIDAFTKQRVDLELSAVSESDYYASLMKFYRPVRIMIWATALLVGLAGMLGGLNTLYAAFAARVRELGMLQSLGFPRSSIVVSLMQESCIAAAAAVLAASILAFVFLDGIAIRFSMGVFQLDVNGTVLVAGVVAGTVIGILGAIPPAWRCLRLPITESLKTA